LQAEMPAVSIARDRATETLATVAEQQERFTAWAERELLPALREL
jgi:hypothetical protein